MGQKVNAIGLRIGINKTWDSRWFSKNEYADRLLEDLKIRRFIKKSLSNAGVSKVVIERSAKKMTINIRSSRPGVIIGKKGADIDKIKNDLKKFTDSEISLNIQEIKKPELDATLVAESVAQQIEKRIAFRKALKRAVQTTMKMGAQGIRINCSGRLGGAEIARMEWYREGRVPLHTLRADIDYGVAEAHTTYGVIGIKVWIFKGEIFDNEQALRDENAA